MPRWRCSGSAGTLARRLAANPRLLRPGALKQAQENVETAKAEERSAKAALDAALALLTELLLQQ
jgi:hypothetical protein